MVADRLCELGRFGQKTGAGWYRYEAGQARPDPRSGGRAADRRLLRKAAGITPRKISDEEIVERCVYALVNEGARILEEGIAAARLRHRHGLPHRLRLPALPRRPDAATPTRSACPTWCARCAASPPSPAPTRSGSRRRCSRSSPPTARPSTESEDCNMTDAVIVSTARTGLAKILARRVQHDPRRHPGRPRRSRHAVERAGIDPAEVEDVIIGCALAEGTTGGNIARADRAARRLPGDHRRHHRQPLLLLRPADHRHGRAARHRRTRCR